MSPAPRDAARILVDQLRIHGVDLAYCVPGESYLAVLDALADANSIRLITCRQESGAAMMAEAYGKLTGKPGICMVTRGPGATNAAAGLHIATQDSTPLILFVGQVARPTMEREAFQELDYRRMFGQLAKWTAQIDDAARIPELVARAFQVATSGRPGPVVLALPEDMLHDIASVPDAQPYRRIESHPGVAEVDAIRAALAASSNPFVILGGSGWSAASVAAIQKFAEANALPVGVSFRRQDRFDNDHPNYAGDVGIGINPKLAQRIKASDLLLVLGARLGEATTGGYSLIDIPTPKQALIHIHPDPEELGRVYQPTIGIAAGTGPTAAALAAMTPVANPRWAGAAEAARADYVAYQQPTRSPGAVQMSEIVLWLNENLPADAIVTNGAGNFTTWVHRFYRYRGFGTQLAPTSGSMGYGFPAALGAATVHPDRVVVCVSGDGDFMMTGQEMATALQHGLTPIVLLVNNGMYGTIRMHQERHYPGRVSGTGLRNPDFVALAKAYGAYSEQVTRTEDFAAAFTRARAAGTAALIELIIDPDGINPRETLSGIRASASKA